MAAPQAVSGTFQNQDINPWDAYAAEMIEKLDPNLEAAVAAYAEHMYEEDQTSSENKEELHRQQEINQEIAKDYQWLKPEEYADTQARIGVIMNHAEFIGLLRKAGVICYYRAHPQPDKVTLLYTKNPGAEALEVGCWATYGYMPELSMMNFDSHGAPTNERRRGWRTCLLQLILKGVISEEKANKVFGKPDVTPQYHRYNATLQSFRNNGSSLDVKD
jgi:hypothetical protein